MLWSNPQKGPLTQCYLAPKDKAASSLSSFHVPLHSNIPMPLLFVLLSLHDCLTSSLLNRSSSTAYLLDLAFCSIVHDRVLKMQGGVRSATAREQQKDHLEG